LELLLNSIPSTSSTMAGLWNMITSPLRRLSGVPDPELIASAPSPSALFKTESSKENICKPAESTEAKILASSTSVSPLTQSIQKQNAINEIKTEKAKKAQPRDLMGKKQPARRKSVSSGSKQAKCADRMAKSMKTKTNKETAKKLVKVKSEKLRSSLRAKTHKVGFYAVRNLENLAWKGQGTESDPITF